MTHLPAYRQFVRARTVAQRAIGRHLVEAVEQGHNIEHLIDASTGYVKGTDKKPLALINAASVAKSRREAAKSHLRPVYHNLVQRDAARSGAERTGT